MSEDPESHFTITLGQSGRVVKRSGRALDDVISGSGLVSGSKLSVKDRLGTIVDDSLEDQSHYMFKRQRLNESQGFLKRNGSNDTSLGNSDLRFKLMQKNVSTQLLDNDPPTNMDLRDKLSSKASVRPDDGRRSCSPIGTLGKRKNTLETRDIYDSRLHNMVEHQTYEGGRQSVREPKSTYSLERQSMRDTRAILYGERRRMRDPWGTYSVGRKSIRDPKDGYDVDRRIWREPRGNCNVGRRSMREPRDIYDVEKRSMRAPKDNYDVERKIMREPRDNYYTERPSMPHHRDSYDVGRQTMRVPRDNYDIERRIIREPRDNYDAERRSMREPRDSYDVDRRSMREPKGRYSAERRSTFGPRDNYNLGRRTMREHVDTYNVERRSMQPRGSYNAGRRIVREPRDTYSRRIIPEPRDTDSIEKRSIREPRDNYSVEDQSVEKRGDSYSAKRQNIREPRDTCNFERHSYSVERRSTQEPRDSCSVGKRNMLDNRDGYEYRRMGNFGSGSNMESDVPAAHSRTPYTSDRSRQTSPDRVYESSLSPESDVEELQKKALTRTYDDGGAENVYRRNEVKSPSRAIVNQPGLNVVPRLPGYATPATAQFTQSSRGVPRIPNHGEHHTIDGFLQSLDLDVYSSHFNDEEVDFYALREMNDTELRDLGIPMGPRKRILHALSLLQ